MTGSELRERRVRLGLSQAELGAKLGVHGNTIARWEREELRVPPYLDLALQTVERNVGHDPVHLSPNETLSPSRHKTVR